jgi:hypothetical protein
MTPGRAIYFVSAFIILSVTGIVRGQSPVSASGIDPELIENAKAVVRLYDARLTISSLSQASLKVTRVVTIMNEPGRRESVYSGIDDKFVTYRFNNLVLYDKDGKKVKNFGVLDLVPMITFSGSTLYSDVHYRTLDPEYRTYPFTVEISYTVDFKGYFYLPDWIVSEDYNVSTEKASFSVVTPSGYDLRFLEQNIPATAAIREENGKTYYEWKLGNVKAAERENFSPELEHVSPAVFLAPGAFEIAGWKGSTTTWSDYGKFIADLNRGRNILPVSVTEQVRGILSHSADTTEIIRELYKMMQEKTRYVSVQIGIGGWQPIEAAKVEETSYGDCKALSNYMKSLLDIAGIKSHYALILAGGDAPELMKAFPSNQFNHAILCVPRGQDTIWLECTSQMIPFNYLGSFTDDRYSLLITEKGGELARTRKYDSDQNRLVRRADVTIDQSGNGKALIKTDHSSFFYDNMMPVLSGDFEDQKRLLTESITVPGFTLSGFRVSQPDRSIPLITEELDITLRGYASVMADRIILPLNLMNRNPKLPAPNSARGSEVLLRREKLLIDTIVYKLPAGYSVTSSLNPVNLESQFGSYNASTEVRGDKLIYIRRQLIRKGRFKASDYSFLVEYNNSVATADMVKVVLKKI